MINKSLAINKCNFCSDHILECLNKAFDEKEEGVVIKEADSLYVPGQRNAGWIKIKPDVCQMKESYPDF